MRRIFVFASIAVFLLLLSACAALPTPTPQPTATTNPILALLAATETSIPTPTLPANTPVPTPYQPFQATVQTDDLLLRQGPGLRLERIAMYPQGEKVKVISQASSGFWLQVQTDDKQSGYMMTNYLKLDGYLFEVPVVQPNGALTIKGHIYTPNGNPATNLGVSLLEANSDNVNQQDVGWTDAFGEWNLFLPAGSEGNWVVRVDSYNCKSNAVNTNCNLIGHFPDPQPVTVPQSPETWVDFQMLQ